MRGFGGPQVYFALERLMQRIAVELGLDPLDVIRRNLIPADAFPYRTATGALLDSGDYQAALDAGGARRRPRRAAAAARRGAGRGPALRHRLRGGRRAQRLQHGLHHDCPDRRASARKAGPKNGAQATATVAIDPLGAVTRAVASVPQGQGHRTVLAQVVADVLRPRCRRMSASITEIDTAKDAWSIASGNYSSRFAAAVAGAAHLAATRLRDKLARIAAAQLNVPRR